MDQIFAENVYVAKFGSKIVRFIPMELDRQNGYTFDHAK